MYALECPKNKWNQMILSNDGFIQGSFRGNAWIGFIVKRNEELFEKKRVVDIVVKCVCFIVSYNKPTNKIETHTKLRSKPEYNPFNTHSCI